MAVLTDLAGASDGLGSERGYVATLAQSRLPLYLYGKARAGDGDLCRLGHHDERLRASPTGMRDGAGVVQRDYSDYPDFFGYKKLAIGLRFEV